jgi:hypothetical protein
MSACLAFHPSPLFASPLRLLSLQNPGAGMVEDEGHTDCQWRQVAECETRRAWANTGRSVIVALWAGDACEEDGGGVVVSHWQPLMTRGMDLKT